MRAVNWNTVDMRLVALAAAIAHVEGYYSIHSVAFKHYNPGNLEASHGEFETYDNPADGFQALLADITANCGTILRDFIAKYAPPVENDTASYLAIVSTLSGIGPDEEL